LGADVKPIINLSTGQAVGERVTIADRPLTRMRGLLGRDSLEHGEGLLLRPAPSIHTAFMRFAIDALFLDVDLRVVRIVEHMGPWRIAVKRRARSVLELAGGEASRRGVALGHRLVVLDSDVSSLNGHQNGDGRDEDVNVVWPEEDFPTRVQAEPTTERHGVDDSERPLRLLVIAHDRRFRTVASALLARRGCVVATSPNANRVAELIAREQPDVVVIDAGALLTAAARTVATVAALQPPVGVVLVDDEAETGLEHMPVLAKWGPFEAFFAAIEQADRDRGRRSRLVG
jgi:uncharacterized protein